MIVASDPAWWFELLHLPLFDRLGPGPQDLVRHAALVNAAQGLPQVPEAAEAPAAFEHDIRAAMRDLPMPVLQMLEKSLLGVYFCQGLGSSAVTDIVVTGSGFVIGAVIGIDLDATAGRSANQWATWRENSAFQPSPEYVLQVSITAPVDDDRMHALQYLLLHEFGHVLATSWLYMPEWWMAPPQLLDTQAYHFLPLGWRVSDDRRIVALDANDFPLRDRVVFYASAQLGADSMPEVYAALHQTTFCSLYGATSVFEDFAESFASFVHVLLLQHHHEVTISRGGTVLMVSAGYWASARSAEKRRFMYRFLGLEAPSGEQARSAIPATREMP